MSRLISASVDDTLYFTNHLRASESCCNQLYHPASAIELRSSEQSKYATARPRKCKGRRSFRANSSLSLSEKSGNTFNSASSSHRSGSKENSFTLQAFDHSGSHLPSPDSGSSDDGGLYPSPPASEYSIPNTPSTESRASEDVDPPAFPLTPVPFSPTAATADRGSRTSRGRGIRREKGLRTPSTSPDRFISSRCTPQDVSKTFRLSKHPEQLSSAEKLLRHRSATPDPFGPLAVRRIWEARINATGNTDLRPVPSRTRTIGTTNVQHPPQDPLATQNRQASAGAVWNVGGVSQANMSGPVRGISDGRGGFVSSGSNAPMFTSHFFDEDTLEQDNGQLESRLAVALDIDQTRRILDISMSPVQGRSVSTGSIGTKRKYVYFEPRTRWMNGQWVQEGSRLREPTLLFACCQHLHPLSLSNSSKYYCVFLSFIIGQPANATRMSSKEASQDGAQSCSNYTLQISPRLSPEGNGSDAAVQC